MLINGKLSCPACATHTGMIIVLNAPSIFLEIEAAFVLFTVFPNIEREKFGASLAALVPILERWRLRAGPSAFRLVERLQRKRARQCFDKVGAEICV